MRKVFADCRTWVYQARLWDADYNLLSSERIAVTATGRAWKPQPDLQDEIVIQYQLGPALGNKLRPHMINPRLDSWTSKEHTGVIENDQYITMHPFRENFYAFTEVAGFPVVHLPVRVGQRWEDELRIFDGWGDWSNMDVTTAYEVVAREEVTLPYGQLPLWHLRAVTDIPLGRTVHDFWFHEQYGFVKFVIKNYAGQLLVIELEELTDGAD
ncbi:MAG: hypothetical protein AAGA85_01425 [Bacteroidota bacterium]